MTAIAGIWTALGVLNVLVFFGTLGFLAVPVIAGPLEFALLFYTPSGNGSEALFPILLPAIFPLFVFLVALVLHTVKKYRTNTIWVGIAILLLVGTWIYPVFYGVQQRQHAAADLAPTLGPTSGFLVPSQGTLPAGFKQTWHQYNALGYILSYKGSDVDPEGRGTEYDTLGFDESDAPYQNTISSEEKNGPGMGIQKIFDFSYQGEPGIVFGTSAYTSDPNSTVSYTLAWNDNGNTVLLTLTDVPNSLYSPQTLITMLGTMVRYDGNANNIPVGSFAPATSTLPTQ